MQETQVQSLGWKDSPGEGNGNPLQYSCLENPMDRGAWWATVHGVTKESDTTERLHFHFYFQWQYMNCELPDVQAGFRKGRGMRDQIVNICWITEKSKFQKIIYFCFIDYIKDFHCVDHNKLWKIFKR